MNTTKLLFGLSIVLFLVAVGVGVSAQSVEPDRISFYNDPADNKLESHVDYADGHDARIRYGACVPGAGIEEALNLYRARFIVEGCTADIHQHLNLRWVQGCVFDMEHDPDARIVTYGDYGQVTITGHYDQGEVTLDVPVGTTRMTAVMSHTIGGELWTGNVEFLFDAPIGCVDAPVTETPTEAATLMGTPTMGNIATETPVATLPPSETPTGTTEPLPAVTPLSTETTMPTMTPTEIVVVDDWTPTATPTSAATVEPADEPTGEQPVGEPRRTLYLPVVSK